MITIVGLGLSSADLTLGASCALLSGRPILLRTGRHPIAGFLQDQGLAFETLDPLYETSQDYDALLRAIAQAVCDRGACVYGVPGGAGISDESVRAVCARAGQLGLEFEVLPGVSHYEHAACRVGGVSGAVCLPAADYDSGAYNPRLPLLLQELHSRLVASEVKLRLLDVYPAEHRIFFGADAIALEDLDRQSDYNHLSCVLIPPLDYPKLERFDLEGLRQVLARLRDPLDGCPWDREQTHESLRKDLLEECYEALDAIDQRDPDHLAEELGDVLLQIGMHAQIASEHGDFDLRDVVSGICGKMIRRHPHVFGSDHIQTAEQVVEAWSEDKKKLRGQRDQAEVMSALPKSLPALLRAEKIQALASPLGYDFSSPQEAMDKLLEEADEARQAQAEDLEMELGDLLFACVNVVRLYKISGEIALHRSCDKFQARIAQVEALAKQRGIDLRSLDPKALDLLWEEAKAALHGRFN